MKRKDSKILKQIYELYDKYELDKDEIYEKTKYILNIYRQSVWATIAHGSDLQRKTQELYGESIDTALVYLSEFATKDEKAVFKEKIDKIFSAKWMVEIIDTAMEMIYVYPDNGEMYFQILSKSYLTKPKYKESEITEMLDIDRSTYYIKRKEAITLLGAQIWGYAVPHIIEQSSYSNAVIEIPIVGEAYT